MDYRYFGAAGKSLEIVQAFVQKRLDTAAARKAFRQKVGATDLWGTDAHILGAVLDGPKPGWQHVPREREGIYRPDRRTREGKAIAREMETLAQDSMWDLTTKLGSDMVMTPKPGGGPGFIAHFVRLEQHGDDFIIHVPIAPDGQTFHPPDAIPMKASEYWTLKEAADEVPTT